MPEITSAPETLTVAEVARELRVGRHAVYETIRRGHLHAYSLSSNSTRIDRAELDRFKKSGGALGP